MRISSFISGADFSWWNIFLKATWNGTTDIGPVPLLCVEPPRLLFLPLMLNMWLTEKMSVRMLTASEQMCSDSCFLRTALWFTSTVGVFGWLFANPSPRLYPVLSTHLYSDWCFTSGVKRLLTFSAAADLSDESAVKDEVICVFSSCGVVNNLLNRTASEVEVDIVLFKLVYLSVLFTCDASTVCFCVVSSNCYWLFLCLTMLTGLLLPFIRLCIIIIIIPARKLVEVKKKKKQESICRLSGTAFIWF